MAVSAITTDYIGAWVTKNPDTIQQFNLGNRAAGDNGGLFLYCKFGAAIATAQFVVMDNSYSITALTTANSPRGAKVGLTRYAGAINQFGWVQVEGQVLGSNQGAMAAASQLNTTATAGNVDSTATVGSKRIDAIAQLVAAAGTSTTTEFMLSQPYVGVTL
jgi:hypothetical protein